MRSPRKSIEARVDLSEHAHHLSCDLFVPLVVARKIEFGKRLSFTSDVTELAANTECGGEVAHRADHVDHGSRMRNDLRVDEPIRRELVRGLAGRDPSVKYENNGENPHRPPTPVI